MHIGSVLLIVLAGHRRYRRRTARGFQRAYGLQLGRHDRGDILAGPLNYTGVHPDIHCTVRHPSN
jgi:hypothetical protein